MRNVKKIIWKRVSDRVKNRIVRQTWINSREDVQVSTQVWNPIWEKVGWQVREPVTNSIKRILK